MSEVDDEYGKRIGELLAKAIEGGRVVLQLNPIIFTPSEQVKAIRNLAEATYKHWIHTYTIYQDPENPSVPRMRIIGNQMRRVSWRDLFRSVAIPSYDHALSLGWWEGFQAWCKYFQHLPGKEQKNEEA